jgi:hypothetical protein
MLGLILLVIAIAVVSAVTLDLIRSTRSDSIGARILRRTSFADALNAVFSSGLAGKRSTSLQ